MPKMTTTSAGVAQVNSAFQMQHATRVHVRVHVRVDVVPLSARVHPQVEHSSSSNCEGREEKES